MPRDSIVKKVSMLNIDGKEYKISHTEKKQTSQLDNQNLKIKGNVAKQAEEVNALQLIHKDKFVIRNLSSHEFTLQFSIRGGREATLDFEYPALYPSDVPPKYQLNAPWIREQTKKEIQVALRDIFSENFGRCFMYLWAEAIEAILKREHQELKNEPVTETTTHTEEIQTKETPVEDKTPEIKEGTVIKDRGSTFTPYIAEVRSIEDINNVLQRLNDLKKVSLAWRNTYAYRFVDGKGKTVELGEDGGEPKAGNSLLTRLVNYGANNVLVFLSRKWGGKKLGPDRFKHLNDAADEVLHLYGYVACGGGKSKNSKQQQMKSNKEIKDQDKSNNNKSVKEKKKK